LELELVLFSFIGVGWESHLRFVEFIEHDGGLDPAHLRHLEARLIDCLFVDPGAVGVLHVGRLIELCGLFASTGGHAKLWRAIGLTRVFRLELVKWTGLDRHLGLELAALRTGMLGGLLEDEFLGRQVRIFHVKFGSGGLWVGL